MLFFYCAISFKPAGLKRCVKIHREETQKKKLYERAYKTVNFEGSVRENQPPPPLSLLINRKQEHKEKNLFTSEVLLLSWGKEFLHNLPSHFCSRSP